MSALKPCPFCGSATTPRATEAHNTTQVHCVFCGAYSTCYVNDSDGAAIAAWNTRPLEDAKDAEIARLENQLELVRLALAIDAPETPTLTSTGDPARDISNIVIGGCSKCGRNFTTCGCRDEPRQALAPQEAQA